MVPENRGDGVHILFLSPSRPASLLPDPQNPLSWALAPAESLSLDPSPWVAIPAGPHTLRCFRRTSTLCLAPHGRRSWTCLLFPVSAPCLPSPPSLCLCYSRPLGRPCCTPHHLLHPRPPLLNPFASTTRLLSQGSHCFPYSFTQHSPTEGCSTLQKQK